LVEPSRIVLCTCKKINAYNGKSNILSNEFQNDYRGSSESTEI